MLANIERRAVIVDEKFRYYLERRWDDGDLVTFIMLNPSTADAYADDPTICRCMNYAQAWGFAGINVVNLYAYRATDPKELETVPDPVGPENDEWIRRVVHDSGKIVAAWGVKAQPERVEQMRRLIPASRSIKALALSKDGIPRHPLYLSKELVPAHWEYGLTCDN